MALTTFMKSFQYNTLFKGGAYTFAHTDAYVGLFTADPTETGDQTNEVSGGSYARVQPTWDTVVLDVESITSDIDFPTATASWGTISHVALLDASTGGNMLAFQPVPSTPTVDNGDTVRLATGTFTSTVTFDAGSSAGEDRPYEEYRRHVLLQSVLHGGTVGPRTVWAGLSAIHGDTGAPGSFTSELDVDVAVGYLRKVIDWTVETSNPLVISNTSELLWTVGNTGTAGSWTQAGENLILVDDATPNKGGDGAPGTRGLTKISGSAPQPENMSPGDEISVPAGALQVTF